MIQTIFPKTAELRNEEKMLNMQLLNIKHQIDTIQNNCKHEETESKNVNCGDYEKTEKHFTCLECGYEYYN